MVSYGSTVETQVQLTLLTICQEIIYCFYYLIAYLSFLVFSIWILLASGITNLLYFIAFYISMLLFNLREGEALSFVKLLCVRCCHIHDLIQFCK